jgi:regulator of replication initiation timing
MTSRKKSFDHTKPLKAQLAEMKREIESLKNQPRSYEDTDPLKIELEATERELERVKGEAEQRRKEITPLLASAIVNVQDQCRTGLRNPQAENALGGFLPSDEEFALGSKPSGHSCEGTSNARPPMEHAGVPTISREKNPLLAPATVNVQDSILDGFAELSSRERIGISRSRPLFQTYSESNIQRSPLCPLFTIPFKITFLVTKSSKATHSHVSNHYLSRLSEASANQVHFRSLHITPAKSLA